MARQPEDLQRRKVAERLIASQRAEIDRLYRDNKRLRTPVPVRRAPSARFTQPPQRSGQVILPPLTPPLAFARQMSAAVVAELRAMTIETRALVKLLAAGPEDQLSQAMDAPPDSYSVPDQAQRRIEVLKAKWQQRFETLAEQWSRRMIVDVVSQSSAQLNLGLKDMAERMAIQSTLATPRMRAVVDASAKSSTQLITRIPAKYLDDVQVQVMSAITTGSGLGELVPYLTKRYKGDARHAHLTALDQVRKVSENVNAARLQSLGVEEYVWIHTGGERYPRKLHVSYSGRTFRYDDPPVIDERTGVKGKPGDAIGCRCRQRAVLNFTKMVEVA